MAVFRLRGVHFALLLVLSIAIVMVEIIYVFNDETLINDENLLENWNEEERTENTVTFNLDENWKSNYSEGEAAEWAVFTIFSTLPPN